MFRVQMSTFGGAGGAVPGDVRSARIQAVVIETCGTGSAASLDGCRAGPVASGNIGLRGLSGGTGVEDVADKVG